MVDVTPVQSFLLEVIPPVAAVGVAVLMLAVLGKTFKWVRAAGIDGVEGAVFKGRGPDGVVFYTDRDGEIIWEEKDLNQAGYDAFHPEPTDNQKLHWSEDQWATYIADQREDDDSARRQCGLEEFQDTVPNPAGQSDAQRRAMFARIHEAEAGMAAQIAQEDAAMTPHEKYLAKATPEDLARDAELEAEIAAEDERIARKYGLGGTHQGEVKVPKLGSGWGA